MTHFGYLLTIIGNFVSCYLLFELATNYSADIDRLYYVLLAIACSLVPFTFAVAVDRLLAEHRRISQRRDRG